jgi:hypothetical protein
VWGTQLHNAPHVLLVQVEPGRWTLPIIYHAYGNWQWHQQLSQHVTSHTTDGSHEGQVMVSPNQWTEVQPSVQAGQLGQARGMAQWVGHPDDKLRRGGVTPPPLCQAFTWWPWSRFSSARSPTDEVCVRLSQEQLRWVQNTRGQEADSSLPLVWQSAPNEWVDNLPEEEWGAGVGVMAPATHG